MSLIEQLRRLATPVAASYAPDSVRRKSLIYEDPSKVDTLLCYQESLAAFERMCKLDEIFIGFRQTIFAETSCHLEICNLFVDEKFKLDNEIRRFLCYTSPFLKHYDAIRMLEWLVHKFQVHTHFVEDLIRCVIPYHETGLFAKFLQLLDFSSVNTEFRWLEPYAQCGRCLSRKELVRACFRQPGLVPFISSLMVNAVKCYQGLPDQSKLNDLTNFFLSTVVALCDTGMADERIAQVLGTLQHVLRVGLRASDCAPFQSAACLAVLRFSMKLQLNPDLVLDWIQCLLKKTRPTQTWESLRVITQLMRTQHIATLPEKLATRHAALLSTLPESQRKLIEQEEERLLDDVDVNQLAHAAALTAEVQAATVTMDVSAPPEDSALCISAIDLTSTKRTYSDTELLSACVNEVQLAHAILAALPETSRCCLFHEQNPTCVCPKMPGFSKDQNSWLTDLLLAGVLSKPATAGKSSKLEVRRARRVLHFAGLAAKAHVKTVQSLSTAPQTRASTSPRRSRATLSKAQCILEDGLDQGIV
ncbi:unnamed protein product [Echinostoma caproni]|uniref:HEAT repeat-containing protein 1 n=1 Tax=Echinostoma caproni TaxID=27848 RepID=A0A182ZZE2_9TREM|nr:unnamed protein product [Echinostoma caproni]